jgi:hypothetical protein
MRMALYILPPSSLLAQGSSLANPGGARIFAYDVIFQPLVVALRQPHHQKPATEQHPCNNPIHLESFDRYGAMLCVISTPLWLRDFVLLDDLGNDR